MGKLGRTWQKMLGVGGFLLLGFGVLAQGEKQKTWRPEDNSCFVNKDIDPACFAQFKQKLNLPEVAETKELVSIGGNQSVKRYTITARPAEVQLGFKKKDGTPVATPVWAYNGQFPGPTIEAQTNTPIVVKWVNGLTAGGKPAPLPFADLGGDPLGIDRTIPGTDCWNADQATNQCLDAYHMVVHFHGGHSVAASDGYADCVYDPLGATRPMSMPMSDPNSCMQDATTAKLNYRQFTYANARQGTSLWYHDHGMGTTRYGVMAGLFGLYFVRDSYERKLIDEGYLPATNSGYPPNDPRGDGRVREIPLVIMDRSFNEDPQSTDFGKMLYATNENYNTYPKKADAPPSEFPSNQAQPEFFGKTILVNGTIWPFLQVRPQRYRFRILNGSNSRVYNLFLEHDKGSKYKNTKVPKMQVIGSDGGMNMNFTEEQLSKKIRPTESTALTIAPGERYDIIIDFTDFSGGKLILRNNAPAPFRGLPYAEKGKNVAAEPNTTGSIMQFDVMVKNEANDKPAVPLTLAAVKKYFRPVPKPSFNISSLKASKVRWLSLHELPATNQPGEQNKILRLGDDGVAHTFMDTPTERVNVGKTEIWKIINFTGDTHPIHIHFVPFQVISRQKIDLTKVTPEQIEGRQPLVHTKLKLSSFVNVTDKTYEDGYKDTVRANPGEITTIAVRFCASFTTDGNCQAYDPKRDAGFLGTYVWHCHILEHEDNEMMRPLVVLAPGAK